MRDWQMQEAKAKLAELVKQAQSQGPQQITVHGKPVAVVLSRERFEQLSQTGESLVAFMRRSPLYDLDELQFERDKSSTREVDV